MACIFMDGFDYYQSMTDLLRRWTQVYNSGENGSISSSSSRGDGQGLLSYNFNGVPGWISKSFGANYVSGCVGFAVNLPAAARQSGVLFILDGTSEQISVRTNDSGVLTVSREDTLLATGTTVLTSNTWYYVELKFTINGSTGVVELHLNGATEIASTGSLNTKATANVQWNGFGIAGSNNSAKYDDIYALDTSTGTNTTFLGDVRVIPVYPAAAGFYGDWTPNGGTNVGCVDDMFEDGDSTFNMSATANNIDSYEMQDLPVASGSTVYAVQPIIVGRKDAGAARTIAPLLRIGGADYVGTTQSLGTSYAFLTQIYDTEPVGGTPAWSVTDVNAMEGGYKLIS